MASRPKRTNGVVAHVTERFGFIDLTNKNIPVSTVYFDFTSFGGKGSDLTKIYPRGTNVSFTFIASASEHNVKHQAINLTKIYPQKGPGSQAHGPAKEISHTVTANKDQNNHGQQSFQEPHNQRSNAGPKSPGGKSKHKGGQGRHHQQPHDGPPHSQYSHEGRNHPGGKSTHAVDQGHGRHDQQPHYGPPHSQYSHEGRNSPGGKPTHVGDQDHGRHHQQPHYGPLHSQYSREGRNPSGGMPTHVGDQGRGYAHQQPHHGPPHSQYPHDGRDLPGGEPKNIDGQGHSNPNQQHRHGSEKFQKPHHQRAHRQDSHESDTQEQRRDSGASYPHDQVFAPQPGNLNITNPGVGRFMQEAVDPRLNKLAEKFSDQPTTPGGRYSAAEQPKPPGQLQIKVARKGSGSKQGNLEEHRKESQKNAPKKAFNDSKGEAKMKKPVPCSEDSGVNAQSAVSGQFTVQPVPQLAQEHDKASGKKQRPRPKKDKLFQSTEVKTFVDLLGKDLSLSWKNKLKSLQLKSLNSLLLLRLTVGKKSSIRVVMDGETSNHTIEDAKSIELEDLQRLLRNNNTIKSQTPLHYGVKGTLHSIRSIEQNGKLTGLTLFFQLHEVHDGLGLEIVDRKGFTGVVSDVRTCPQKYIYNYLRCKSQEMANTKDVLVLDVDGQLSGCDDSAHASLGDVTRIACSSSSELTTKITEAIEHLHECVIVIGVDSIAILQALQKMANKGASVLAGISPDMKAEVETTFAE